MKPYSLTFMCLIFLSVLTANVTAQADKSTRPSPPMEVKGKLQGAQVNISYSSPSVKGRTIWGDLVPYGKVWIKISSSTTKNYRQASMPCLLSPAKRNGYGFLIQFGINGELINMMSPKM